MSHPHEREALYRDCRRVSCDIPVADFERAQNLLRANPKMRMWHIISNGFHEEVERLERIEQTREREILPEVLPQMAPPSPREENGAKRGPMYLDPAEAASYVGCSVSQIDVLVRNGELPFVKIGRSRRYFLTDLDDLLRRHRTRKE